VRRRTWFILGGLLVALLLAGVVSNFASGSPDGLDSAAKKGCTTNAEGEITGGSCMAQNAKEHELGDGPLAGYGIRGIDNAYLSAALSGVAGVLLTFAVGGGIFWLARSRSPTHSGRLTADSAALRPLAADRPVSKD
jgi:cobalt/nickel transport protein